jgi:hypothetical protein
MLALHSGWPSDLTKAGFRVSIRSVIGELGNSPALLRGEIQGTQLAIPVPVVLKFVARGYPALVFSVWRELTVVTVLVCNCSCKGSTDGQRMAVLLLHIQGAGVRLSPL